MACPTGYNTVSTSLGDLCLPTSVPLSNQTAVTNYLGYSTNGVMSSSNQNSWQQFLALGAPFTNLGTASTSNANSSAIILIIVMVVIFVIAALVIHHAKKG
jgi:hypothetical protein